MKKWTWFILLILVIIVVCWLLYHYYNTPASNVSNASQPVQKNSITTVSNVATKQPEIPHSAIIGLWTDGQVNYDNIEFKNDSITYHQFKNSYPYFFDGDSIKIEMSDMTLKGKVLLNTDTLKIISEDGGMTLWRMKKKG